jgi:hypothetical protein
VKTSTPEKSSVESKQGSASILTTLAEHDTARSWPLCSGNDPASGLDLKKREEVRRKKADRLCVENRRRFTAQEDEE